MRQNYKAGEMGEMENTATCQALLCENFWSFQLIFFLKKSLYGISPDNPKDKSRFLFPSTKDQTILCVTQDKEKI